MDFLKRFFLAIFAGFDPEGAGTWVRALVLVLWAGAVTGVVDVLVQFLSVLQSGDPFVIDWLLVIRTIAIAVLPTLIGFLRPAPKTEGQ